MRREISEPVYETMNLLAHENIVVRTNHSTGDYVVSHWHDAMEIIYISRGDLTVTMAEQDHHMTDDTFLLINSSMVHSTRCLHENDALVLQLPNEFLVQHMKEMDQLIFRVPFLTEDPGEMENLAKVKGILQSLNELYQVKPEGMRLKQNSLIFELLYQLYCNFKLELPEAKFLKHTKNLSILKKIMIYSEEHHGETIRIDEIAKVAGLQPKYFCRFFKNNVGVTYLNYLNELRISEIYQELISTDLPLFQILDQHGFTNSKLFRRMFRERFANTPMQIRKLRKL